MNNPSTADNFTGFYLNVNADKHIVEMVQKIFLFIITIVGISCGTDKKDKPVCQLKEIKTLYYDPNMHVGVDTAYGYVVLIKEFSRECMDSTTLVDIALRFIDTSSHGKPVNGVAFYSSDKDFIPTNTLRSWTK